MQKFASIIDDKEWSDILINMNNDISTICLSETEMKFLENVSLLEHMKTLGCGCEALSRYEELSVEGWFGDLWEKIKTFFINLWNKFVNFIKNIPNFIRPYMSRANSLRTRIGNDLHIKPNQQLLLLNPILVSKRDGEFKRFVVQLNADNVPAIIDSATNLPIKNTIKAEDNKLEQTLIVDDAAFCAYTDFLINMYNQIQSSIEMIEKSFNVELEKFKTSVQEQGITNIDFNKIVKDFNDDLLLITNFEKLMVETAKNLCKVQLV